MKAHTSLTLKPKPGLTGETSLAASRLTSPVAAAKSVMRPNVAEVHVVMRWLLQFALYQVEQSQGRHYADLAMHCPAYDSESWTYSPQACSMSCPYRLLHGCFSKVRQHQSADLH